MLKHYLVAAWANCRRSPFAAAVNVLTLALGLVCFILAASTMAFLGRADRQFANGGRTFVMTLEWRAGEFGSGIALPQTPYHLAGYLEADFPQIETLARVSRLDDTLPVKAGNRALRMRAYGADAEFLDIFYDLPFLEGDARTALRAPASVVLTREAARSLYGDAPAVGRPITLYGDIEATVTGVLDRIPEPSHMGRSASAPLRFDVLTSRDVFERYLREAVGRDSTQLPEDWTASYGPNTTYVLLPDDFTATMLRAQLPAFVERHVPADERARLSVSLDVAPVSSLLVMAARDALLPRESAVSLPLLMLALGTIVLVVACVNFANLATARAAGRAREIGVRKAIGAAPRQVIAQYLLEAGILTAAALALAVVLLLGALPALESTTGIDLRLLWSASFAARSAAALLGLCAAVACAAGFYPAFVLSRVQPALAVRAAPSRTGPRSLAALLVGVQFAFAAFLLIAVSIVHEQNERLEHAGRETAAEPLLVIENDAGRSGVAQQTLHEELARLPQVRSATTLQTLPWGNFVTRFPLSSTPSATAVERTAFLYVVGYDFFETFDIGLLAGRWFDPERADDFAVQGPNPTRTQSIVISRGLARELGFDSPTDVVDKMLYIPRSLTGEARDRPFQIIGVVEDKTLAIATRFGRRPNAYLFSPDVTNHVVRLAGDDAAGAIASIDALWKRLAPNVAIKRRLLADYFDDGYASFARINQAFTALALIAWTISTIGLYAMAIVVAGRRLREIAIRKTLGARTRQIVVLLLGSFSRPVLLANVAAWPFAYLAARAYLDVFVDPMPLTPWPFAVGLAVSLIVAWVAVGGQSWRA
ncbi:MAG TPA: ABC transporter permease, partial [Gammaproteobacteria bacterium]|nr:ABC transporter permease [Gammaproteobacteria bacterium]